MAEMKSEDTEKHTGLQVHHEVILDHFRKRLLQGRGQRFHDSVYLLLGLLFGHRDFDSVESLIEYCADHDNLRPWLLHEADRAMFSAELVHGLHDMISKTGGDRPSGPTLE